MEFSTSDTVQDGLALTMINQARDAHKSVYTASPSDDPHPPVRSGLLRSRTLSCRQLASEFEGAGMPGIVRHQPRASSPSTASAIAICAPASSPRRVTINPRSAAPLSGSAADLACCGLSPDPQDHGHAPLSTNFHRSQDDCRYPQCRRSSVAQVTPATKQLTVAA